MKPIFFIFFRGNLDNTAYCTTTIQRGCCSTNYFNSFNVLYWNHTPIHRTIPTIIYGLTVNHNKNICRAETTHRYTAISNWAQINSWKLPQRLGCRAIVMVFNIFCCNYTDRSRNLFERFCCFCCSNNYWCQFINISGTYPPPKMRSYL